MTDFDTLHRFTFTDAPVRGELVRLKDSLQTMLGNADYPAEIKTLMAELASAAALLTATLKFEGEISLQIQGKGAVNYAIVSADHKLNYRGIARWDESMQTLPQSFSELCADSVLVITITPNEGERYQGVVALDKPTLAACLENYFLQSEQLLTKVYLFEQTDNETASAGFMLQVLPSSAAVTATEDADDFHHFTALADTLTAEEILSLPVKTVLHRLYHEHDITLFESQPIAFKCTCSKDRSATALLNVEKDELLAIVEEEGCITMNCQYCHTEYRFDAIDVEAIHNGAAAGGSSAH
ncbi:Hsp33 family molecular chaperone HslO [Alteromonas sediminis]|uniref:Hsp33 family molecular chaperone HslO n=1 Tax=Alteromonas sediminis TaxID=2259342 RepID=A0A3N5Y7E4_9ALTE|nr:Hsp33 family molecular chaperone HslO [Alteromonas sediminis]RPJ66699.1 Hsp33 family molecular chaperone HslO [Alteromonas sediminis]